MSGKNLLIFSRRDYYDDWGPHDDPTFDPEWSYCNNQRLEKTGEDKHVFFHETIYDINSRTKRRYIRGFFVVKEVGPGKAMVKKYKLKHAASHAIRYPNHQVLIGDRNKSKEFESPGLLFDKRLAQKLTFDPKNPIRFRNDLSELQCISSATRQIRVLTDDDVKILMVEARRLNLM